MAEKDGLRIRARTREHDGTGLTQYPASLLNFELARQQIVPFLKHQRKRQKKREQTRQ